MFSPPLVKSLLINLRSSLAINAYHQNIGYDKNIFFGYLAMEIGRNLVRQLDALIVAPGSATMPALPLHRILGRTETLNQRT